MPPPTILHLDMDAFFASIEQARDPALKGKPLCVGGVPGKDRSVVTAASYEARVFGIRAGMPLYQAKRLCPQAIFVRTNGYVYLEVSKRVVKILQEFSDRVEPSSIDESYVDIAGVLDYFGGDDLSGWRIGRQIKDRILNELHLTCSIGIAPTRILAKIGSDMQKPDGLTIIKKEEIEKIVYPLVVEKVPGIGPRLKATLNGMGIITIGQLANAAESSLYKRFGINGTRLQRIVRGELDWEVLTDDERPDEKSIGHSRTFGSDTNDPEELKGYLLTLVQMVARRMRQSEVAGRTLALTIRYGDFHTITHRKSWSRLTSDENDLFKISCRLFEEYYLTGCPVRLLGVSVSNLTPRNTKQMDLFDRHSQIYPALDALREKYGEGIVRPMSTMGIHLRKHVRNVNFAKPNVNSAIKKT